MARYGYLYPEYGVQLSSTQAEPTLTLVTMFYSVFGFQNSDILRHAESVLALNIDLVIFTEPDKEDYFYQRRQELAKTRKTLVCARQFQQLSSVNRYLQIARVNWDADAPNFTGKMDNRHTPEYCMMASSKVSILGEIAELNPFFTSHFGWIDLMNPSPAVHSQLPLQKKDVICIQHVNALPKNLDTYPLKTACYVQLGNVIGTYFTATRRAAIGLAAAYQESLREILVSKRHCPTDEAVLTWTVILFPEMFQLYPLKLNGA
jgi:hypothetical protein